MTSLALHTSIVGSGAHRAVFLHGLLGRGKNFTRIAKGLGEVAQTLLVDLPNHGASPWTAGFDYVEMADIAAATIQEFAAGEKVTLIGHSMGGKTAMLVALRHPHLVERLVVIDIAPGQSKGSFEVLMDGMLGLPIESYSSRAQANTDLAASVPAEGTRSFLLQNLVMGSGANRWDPNLTMLREYLPAIMGWPGAEEVFDGKVLWVAGGDSPYITPADTAPMRALFPRVRKVTIKGVGHWVHAEKPDEVIYLLKQFMTA